MASPGEEQPDSNALYRLLARHIPNASVFLFDRQLNYILAEGQELELRGYPPESFVGKHLRDINPEYVSAITEPMLLRALQGEINEAEIEFMGYLYWTQTAPVRDSTGEIVGALILSMNVTERKHAEIAQAERERLIAALEKEQELSAQRNKMMLRIAHEFRNPLAIILSSSEIMRRYAVRMSPEQLQEHFRRIEHQIKHLTHLLDEIASVVQRHDIELDLEMIDLRSFTQEVITDRVKLSIDGDYGSVLIDVELFRVIIRHLLSNALKYSSEDKPVLLHIDVTADDIIITVRDDGIGIMPDEQPNVFNPFFRGSNFTERPGLGLGLTKVQQAVRLYGGEIELTSQPDLGTTVTVTLPRIE
jgi:PAS domain S-box-containing protein